MFWNIKKASHINPLLLKIKMEIVRWKWPPPSSFGRHVIHAEILRFT